MQGNGAPGILSAFGVQPSGTWANTGALRAIATTPARTMNNRFRMTTAPSEQFLLKSGRDICRTDRARIGVSPNSNTSAYCASGRAVPSTATFYCRERSDEGLPLGSTPAGGLLGRALQVGTVASSATLESGSHVADAVHTAR